MVAPATGSRGMLMGVINQNLGMGSRIGGNCFGSRECVIQYVYMRDDDIHDCWHDAGQSLLSPLRMCIVTTSPL